MWWAMRNSRVILHCKMKINILFTSWLKKNLTYMYYTMYIAILIYVLIIIRIYYNVIIYNYQHPVHNTHLRQSRTNIQLTIMSSNWTGGDHCIPFTYNIEQARSIGWGAKGAPPPPTFCATKMFLKFTYR